MSDNPNDDLSKNTLVFVCCNKKFSGKCCAMADAENIYEHLRQEINAKRPLFKVGHHVKAVKTSCLGQCATGPNILVSPDDVWYAFKNVDDINEIVDSHLVNGIIVDRLVKT